MPELVVASRNVAPAILDALKIDVKNVTRLELDFNVEDLAFCRIEFYPTPEQIQDVTEALETQMKCYALAELGCDHRHPPEQ